jgi:carbonic anhydrase
MGSIKKIVLTILVGTFPLWVTPLAMTDTGENNPSAGESRSAQGESKGVTNHWGYEGVEGPGHWAMLEPSYMTCEAGRQQSPINIEMPRHGENQEELTFHYQPTPLRVRNNGHTIQVNYQEGSYLRLNGQSYKLRQFHFHDPSEHHIDGKTYPMEMHLVHQDDRGHILVVGILMALGKENHVFSRAGDWLEQQTGHRLPPKVGEISVDVPFNLMDLLPSNTHHFSYHGSLTTPPCSEGVQWIVLKTPIEISKVQAERFTTTIGPNARPIQPLGGREILEE